jgi:hypothetical protein
MADGKPITESPADAQARLRGLGIPFSEGSFFDYIAAGDAEVVNLMLSAGIRLGAKNNRGVSAVTVAAEAGHTSIVKTLLDRGASLEDLVNANKDRARRKDVWDKLSSVAPVATILSGLIVAGVGGWFTKSYNDAQVRNGTQQASQEYQLKEIEIVEKMIPHFAESERNKQAALVAIGVLTDKSLSTKLAEVYKGNGSVDYLQELVASSTSTSDEKNAALEAIVHVLDAYRPAIVKVSSANYSTTGFIAESSAGHNIVVTAAYKEQKGPFTVETYDGQTYQAQLKPSNNEVAYLSMDGPQLLALKASTLAPTPGTRVIGVGFLADNRNLSLQLGTLLSYTDETVTARYDRSDRVLTGFGGSPILDSTGAVVGIAYAFRDGVHIIARYKPLT